MDKQYKYLIWLASIAVPALVGYLIFIPGDFGAGEAWVVMIPHFNAAINTFTGLLLVVGLYFIKTKRVKQHKAAMLTAFFLGCIFLIAYVVYHSSVPSTSFGGGGTVRVIYYILLITHILLAIAVVPFVLMALYYALKNKIPQHKRIVKIAYPIWLYVSVSGVLVYFLIRPYYS